MARTRILHAELRPLDVREILRRQIGDALDALRKKEPFTDESVHLARKTLKRARASLRLLREAVGKAVYARENARLRNAARPLGRVRDAKVTLDTLDSLLTHEKEAPRRSVLLKLRRTLRKTRVTLHRELQAEGALKESVRSVEEARHRIEQWRVPGDGSPALHAGLKRIYRRGRKALAAVDSDCSDENLHESRKQAKFLGQAMEIFELTRANHLAKHIKRAESIADWLGNDHDLAILRDAITTFSPDSHKTNMGLLARIEHRRKELQSKALKQGRRMYRGKAKAFIENVMGLG
jgi:CHAD domain-containing protein